MSRRSEWPAWKRALFVAGLLLTSLHPVQGAAIPRGGPGEEVSACCVDPEGCCPEDGHAERGQSYAGLCCGVEAPASLPGESATPQARTPADPTETVLRLFARAARQSSAQSWTPPVLEPGRIELAHGPPSAGSATPIEGHWFTERELGSALALLSVLRL